MVEIQGLSLAGWSESPVHASVFVYKESLVSIKIFDVFGTEVIRLINNKVYSPCTYPFLWEGLTGFSREAESGIYYISFESGRDVLSEKLLRIR